MASHLVFRVLGPLEVERDGIPLPLRGSKLRGLLGLLLFSEEHVVPADALIEALWGDEPPATARTALQMHVSKLRKLLHDDSTVVLETKDHGYLLRLAPDRLDLDMFRRLVAQGRTQIARGEHRAARETLEVALGLCRGAPLANVDIPGLPEPELAEIEEMMLAASRRPPGGGSGARSPPRRRAGAGVAEDRVPAQRADPVARRDRAVPVGPAGRGARLDREPAPRAVHGARDRARPGDPPARGADPRAGPGARQSGVHGSSRTSHREEERRGARLPVRAAGGDGRSGGRRRCGGPSDAGGAGDRREPRRLGARDGGRKDQRRLRSPPGP